MTIVERTRDLCLIAVLAGFAAFSLVVGAPARAEETPAFAKVRADVAQSWPKIKHLPADDFARLSAEGAVVLDVRTPEEYAVSHLQGAVRVDPDISAAAFRSAFGDRIKGKMVLVYCSVGVRSSKLATSVAKEVETAGGKGVANLAGGIFGWHNEARPLVDARGPTSYVHAYSTSWGAVLSRPELIRTEPQGNR